MTLVSFAVSSLRDDIDPRELDALAGELAQRLSPALVTPIIYEGDKRVARPEQSTADVETVGRWWGEKMAAKHGRTDT